MREVARSLRQGVRITSIEFPSAGLAWSGGRRLEMSALTEKERLNWLEVQAERAYEAMYDARFGTAGHYSRAKEFFEEEIALACSRSRR